MNKKVLVAVLAASVMVMTACSKEPVETTVDTTEASTTEITVTEVTATEGTTEASSSETTEPTTTVAAGIDEIFDSITNDYFDFSSMLDTNDDIIDSRGALGVSGLFNIYEFKSTEGLVVGDKIRIESSNPAESGKVFEYNIAAINGQYVLIATEWGDVENDHAPYTTPEVQAVYDAFVAYS
ncbi:hypothetical protein SAMN02910456_02451 [Ruminococcaceae bacterium YRB3002]|nr:hypothetical protein SAMN02910456_02451 [Ruminococcaceae bacterium YRB3002]